MIIYKTTNLVNGKIYIGKHSKSDDIYLGSGKLLIMAIEKYGRENFIREIIDQSEDINELNEKEIYWIDKYNSRDRSIGYNIANGGQGGDVRLYMSDEQYLNYCQSISISKKGKTKGIPLSEKNKIGISKGLKNYYSENEHISKGIPLSEETKEKISIALKGREFTDEWKLKLKESRSKLDISGKNNPMYGKSVYDVWLDKYGEEEANIRLKNMKEKLSIAGKSKKKETNN
jgi:hypothetical protein